MKGRGLGSIVEECLQRLDQGENLPDVLADFPSHTDQLERILLVAMASRAFPVPVPCQTAQRLGRNQMLAEMNRMEVKQAFRKKPAIPRVSRWMGNLAAFLRTLGYNKLAFSSRLAMGALVLVFSAGFLTVNASASSQPGDLLYNLKLGLERAGLVQIDFKETPGRNGDLGLPGRANPAPWGSEHAILALNSLFDIPDDPGGVTIPFTAGENSTSDEMGSPDSLKEEAKDLKEAEKEAEKDLKEDAKDLAAAEKEEDKDLAAAEKEEDKDLKEEDKETAAELKEEEKQSDQDLKEQEKDEKAEIKETDKGENIDRSQAGDKNPKK